MLQRKVHVFVPPPSSSSSTGAALHRDAEGGCAGEREEDEDGDGWGRGLDRAEDPPYARISPPSAYFPVVAVIVVVVIVVVTRAARTFSPRANGSPDVASPPISRERNRSRESGAGSLAFKDVPPSAPRVDNSLSRARPAEFCLSSPSLPLSPFYSLSLALSLPPPARSGPIARRERRPSTASFPPPRIGLLDDAH